MTFNVISEVLPHATSAPDRIALAVHREPRDVNSVETATFRQLVDRAERFAAGLEKAGIGFGDRVILASAPSVDFYALALALLGHGGALVLIDGAMDRRRLLGAMRASRASAIVSIDAVMKRWPLVPPLWRMRRYSVDRARPGVRALDGLAGDGGAAVSAGFPRLVEGDTPGVISFTSGTSGRAKGANRTTGILMAQHRALARHLPLEPGDVDMTCFPAVVLHNLACGVTTVLPPLDLRHPATVDPPLVTEAMRRFSVTTMTGAPAYLTKLARHIVDSGEPPSTVRRVVAGGAPVPRRLCELLIEAFPRAEVVVVYGSTEAEPISHVHAEEVRDRPGEGLLVGAPVAEIELEVLTLPDSIERTWTPDEIAAARTPLGEVVVAGAHVNRDYFGDPGANALNKLHEPGGKVWHRTRDVARVDAADRLWLLGRVGDAIQHNGTLVHPLPVEAAVTALDGVRGAGLVAHDGAPEGELAVVADPAAVPAVRSRLADLGLADLKLTVVDSIPVDVRHNSKVDRGALRRALA